jgi:flagellar capping protein FliD
MSGLEAMRASINSYIDTYNQLAIELNGIATETNELNQSLDSSLAPAPSI